MAWSRAALRRRIRNAKGPSTTSVMNQQLAPPPVPCASRLIDQYIGAVWDRDAKRIEQSVQTRNLLIENVKRNDLIERVHGKRPDEVKL